MEPWVGRVGFPRSGWGDRVGVTILVEGGELAVVPALGDGVGNHGVDVDGVGERLLAENVQVLAKSLTKPMVSSVYI